MTSVAVVVFDGLRPDLIRPDLTPNLVRFSAMGATMRRAHSVFPSETRVCTSSVATGCHPRRHGVVANLMFHPLDPSRMVKTGDGDVLRALEQEMGQALLQRPGLSEILAGAGRDYAVFSSGSTGQCFLLAPQADRLGQIVVSAHGAHYTSIAGQSVLAKLPPPPAEATGRAVWIADAWRNTMLPEPPAASVIWLCEPDTAQHYSGLDTDLTRTVLHQVDAAFGRILDDWQAGPHRDSLQIIVASDHGHITVGGLIDAKARLAQAPELVGCFVGGGGIKVPGGERGRIEEVVQFLMRQDWTGNVFAADIADIPAGALPLNAVLVDHARAGHVLYTLRNSRDLGPTGLPGTTLYAGSDLKVGAGIHGGLNEGELSTVLMLAGSAIRPGSASDWASGLIDIAPTVLALLGESGGAAMDGRVLAEVMQEGTEPTDNLTPESWEASGDAYAQRVARVRIGPHVWLESGSRA
eukprot:gene5761-5824_t